MARVARRGAVKPVAGSANAPRRHSGSRLEAANQARLRFLTWASHELRTPLNAILCYNDLLQMGVLGTLNERQEAAVERMGAAIRRLCHLIDDLFELCELDSDEPAVSEATADLRRIIDDVVARLRPRAVERGLHLVAEGSDEEESYLDTDGGKVRRALLLLCGHALTLTECGGVTVRLRTRPNGARIDVIATTCLGVAAAADAAAFRRVDREDAAPGVMLAHRLAEAVGGRIAVHRRPDGDTTTSLRLPARVPAS